MLKVINLSKSYDRKTFAVKDVSFKVERGSILALLGHNGAGKTTILKMISGTINVSTGRIIIDGMDLSKIDSRTLRNIKRNIGFIPETSNLLEYLTAWEYLYYIGKLYGIEDEEFLIREIDKLINKFNITDAQNTGIGEYSSGLKRRIALASIMINNPDFLLLDEPTAHLDPNGVHLLKQYLKELSGIGTAIIMATHHLEVADKVADQILIINNGEKAFYGTINELRGNFEDMQEMNNLEILYSRLIKS